MAHFHLNNSFIFFFFQFKAYINNRKDLKVENGRHCVVIMHNTRFKMYSQILNCGTPLLPSAAIPTVDGDECVVDGSMDLTSTVVFCNNKWEEKTF